MNNLSIIIVSRNDEDVLANALATCVGFGEILVVDGGNSRKTEQICHKFKARYVRNTFKDFADQRNTGMYHVNTPWVLYIDSDERLTDDFKKEVATVVENHDDNSDIAGYYVLRKTYFYGQDWGFYDRVQRLLIRNKFIEWQGVVHESPKVKGEFGQIESPILHFTHRNLSQMIRKTNEWSLYEAKLRHASNHPPLAYWRFFRVMLGEFASSYIKGGGYKNGTYGIIEAMYQAFSIFITYAKLWELQNKKSIS